MSCNTSQNICDIFTIFTIKQHYNQKAKATWKRKLLYNFRQNTLENAGEIEQIAGTELEHSTQSTSWKSRSALNYLKDK